MTLHSKLAQNFQVQGAEFDRVEDSGKTLLFELFPDQTTLFIEDYERVFNVSPKGGIVERRAAVVAAMRQRGGLTTEYYEGIGDTLGDGNYTVVVTAGTGNIPFIVATYSPLTTPVGPASTLPAPLYDSPGDSPFLLTATVTGSAGPEVALERMFDRLVPAWAQFQYVYVP